MWVASIDKAINDALNNIQNKSIHNTSSNFNMSSSNDINYSNLEESESNSELFDLNEPYSTSFNNDSHQNESHLQNSSSNNHLTSNNTSFKSLKDSHFNNSTNSIGNSHSANGKMNHKHVLENKKNLLFSVNGNQNCCDCGASNPTWVSKTRQFLEKIST